MRKTITTISVDVDIYDKFCRAAGDKSKSKIIQEFMDRYSRFDNQNDSEIDVSILRKQKELLEKKQMENVIELQSISENINKIEEIKQEETIKALEEEKKVKEMETRCINCGSTLGFKFHRFPKGHVCRSCFLTCNKEDVARWS